MSVGEQSQHKPSSQKRKSVPCERMDKDLTALGDDSLSRLLSGEIKGGGVALRSLGTHRLEYAVKPPLREVIEE